MSDGVWRPKPVKRPKKSPAPMRRSKPIGRKSWGVKRKAGGTAHGRRRREPGFVHFCHERGCELALDAELQHLLSVSHDCSFEPVEFAHLHDLRRYAPGDVGAGLCRPVHRGIDGKVGGKLPWYVALGYDGQHMIRMRLANRARAAWDALTDEQRAEWERKAAAWRSSGRIKG